MQVHVSSLKSEDRINMDRTTNKNIATNSKQHSMFFLVEMSPMALCAALEDENGTGKMNDLTCGREGG